MLSSSERRELQSLVAKRGLEVGPVDGKVGPRTRAAIRAYQRSVGLAPDGYANSAAWKLSELIGEAATELG
jgi:membrane-bound lytic murein transglycosylase B